MSNLRLSIIVPFYNVESYISQCLDSIYHQDIPEEDYEVICVDDCSPDNSREIVERYAEKHSNLKLVINKENRKLGGARNAGMEVASGDYIWFIDSDDFIEENVLGTLLQIAEKESLEVLHFNYEGYPDKNLSDNNRVAETEIMTGAEMFFDKRFIWYHDLVTAWRKLYKRSFLVDNDISFAEHIMFEDNDYAYLVFAYAQRVKHINLSAYFYRSNPESITRVNISSQHIAYWMDLCHRLIKIKTRLAKDNKDERFQHELSTFIRYHFDHSISSLKYTSNNDRRQAYRIINRQANISLFPFVSKKKFIKLKLGLL